MNRKRVIVFILVFILIGIQVTNVIASVKEVKDSSFFNTNKQEISQGETLEMTLNISKIKYDKFDFKLSSNLDTNNIVINENVKAESYNNDISISIDKSKTKLDKITFYYRVPENAQVGTKIELVAQIIAIEEIKSEQTSTTKVNSTDAANNKEQKVESKKENNVTGNTGKQNDNKLTEKNENKQINKSIENKNNSKEDNEKNDIKTESKVVENKKIEVKIIESKNSEAQEKEKGQSDIEKDDINTFQKEKQQNVKNTDNDTKIENKNQSSNKTMPSSKVQSTTFSTSAVSFSSSASIQTETEKAVYNGSNNNYLSSIEIEGESLNTTFNKENSTYFIETTGKTELNVNVAKEDETSKVYITGNESLKTGDNKILISVTAENGDVRYYRVFVTNK